MPLYLILVLAVIAETIGTTALQASQQFTRFWPSVLVIFAYCISFYLLSITMRSLPVGIVYALWSGLGIVMIAGIGWLVFDQSLDLPAILGLMMIVGGIVVIHLFSSATPH